MPDEDPVRAARGNLSERIPREEELDESMEEENRMRASETYAHPVTYVQQSSTLDGRHKEDSSSVIFIERKVISGKGNFFCVGRDRQLAEEKHLAFFTKA